MALLRLIPALLALLLSGAALGADPQRYVQAALVSERAVAAPGTTVLVGLRMQIHPGWHTYWRNPGDSGIATTIEWTLPQGYAAGDIQWPLPERHAVGPLMNYGYAGEVILPVAISVPASATPGSTARIEAFASWLVCEAICIPEEDRLTIALPIGAAASPDPATADLFRQAREAQPKPSPWPAKYARDGKRVDIVFEAPGLDRDRLLDVYFFPYGETVLEHAAPQRLTVDGGALRLSTSTGTVQSFPASLDGLLVVEERIDGRTVRHGFTVAAAAGAAAAPTAAAGAAGETDLWAALLLALLGGLILNLMPCVFPVLSIKAIGLVAHAHGDRGVMRGHGLAYTAGVLVSFAAVAGALIAVRAGGAELGWGFQLQSPAFVAVLAYVMFAVGLNLAGLLPVGGSFDAGGSLAAKQGYVGSFFTGALATLVATPCTAPFMVTAMGFALAAPWPIALLVFEALGLGLALPYLAIAMLPALARLLPRPGAWMEVFRQALAFPMFAAAAWLVWVLSLQTGADGLAAVLAGFVLLGFAAWLWLQARSARQTARLIGGGLALLALAGAVFLIPRDGTATAPGTGAASAVSSGSGPAWETFSLAKLEAARAEGRPVFVNMTAAWCITCLVNERIALDTAAAAELFSAKKVLYLKGDWTNRDAEISRFLASHGRNGVPLYVLYPPKGEPIVLPQLLTEASLRAELTRL
ncbi:protein-disulfide reductase DsbD family protein [Desertibaculum subflavum]|uniref:protein-disulfide reductase DsbD family protein n=1 Tax=Desertibaculum subflavum TaxID=2268458 RepID=UPI0034D187FB